MLFIELNQSRNPPYKNIRAHENFRNKYNAINNVILLIRLYNLNETGSMRLSTSYSILFNILNRTV